MKRLIWLVLSLSLLVPGSQSPKDEPDEKPAVYEVRMTAKKYQFTPNEVRVKQGERVRLLITALDRKHGFKIKNLGIKTKLRKGRETVVEFVANETGEFEFKCSVFFGLGHRRMRGKLTVE
ncbi:MAG: cupredoxin domain-containing protein [Candidatus Binatia bacterium]